MTRMNLSKRLKRLEANVLHVTERFVFKIQFVCPQRGVVSSLTLGGGPNGEDLWERDIEASYR